ncbi:hypothetical protein MOD96_01900 [Bacillus sp. S17B2]|uniref:DUF7678 domain-containing protein n=1 Tax=Bacillus sp. S17B2 TaxID=2918907 RepID=UPI0022809A3C|nr:hypothetical protein [Bacillus sp. S17B2]
MNIRFTKFKSREQWVEGIVNDGEYSFIAKLFDEGSKYGINNGRVSSLSISIGSTWSGFNNCVVNYERHWDIRPSKEYEDLFKFVLNFLENAPKTRF